MSRGYWTDSLQFLKATGKPGNAQIQPIPAGQMFLLAGCSEKPGKVGRCLAFIAKMLQFLPFSLKHRIFVYIFINKKNLRHLQQLLS
jgi:hypothetical protein